MYDKIHEMFQLARDFICSWNGAKCIAAFTFSLAGIAITMNIAVGIASAPIAHPHEIVTYPLMSGTAVLVGGVASGLAAIIAIRIVEIVQRLAEQR